MGAARTPPYAPGDRVRAEYPSQWGNLTGTAPVLTCAPTGTPNRWSVTARLGSEDRGEAVTVDYVVNSVHGSRWLRPDPGPDDLAGTDAQRSPRGWQGGDS